MPASTIPTKLKAAADEVTSALAKHRQVPTFSSRAQPLTLSDAYRVAEQVRASFEARGEKIVGRKIGFTNCEMWKLHGVKAPIWGYVTDRTICELEPTLVRYVGDFAEPRIEPEIMFGLKAAPRPGMSDEALLDCIDWASFGFEIVQSIYPNWKFAAPDAVAANSLHGALLTGKRHQIAADREQWLAALARFEVELSCNDTLSQRGGGALVLGSPLQALRHLVEILPFDPAGRPSRRARSFQRAR